MAKRRAAAAFAGYDSDADLEYVRADMRSALKRWQQTHTDDLLDERRAAYETELDLLMSNNAHSLAQKQQGDQHSIAFLNHVLNPLAPRETTDRMLAQMISNAVGLARIQGVGSFLRSLKAHRAMIIGHDFMVQFAYNADPDVVAACERVIRNAVKQVTAAHRAAVRDVVVRSGNDVNLAGIISEYAGFQAHRRPRCRHHTLRRGAHRFAQNGRARVKGVCAACGARVNRFAPQR